MVVLVGVCYMLLGMTVLEGGGIVDVDVVGVVENKRGRGFKYLLLSTAAAVVVVTCDSVVVVKLVNEWSVSMETAE